MSTTTRYFGDVTTPLAGFGALAFSVRDFVVYFHVGRVAELGVGGIDRHTTVIASISELTSAPGHPVDFPFIGRAAMQILNIAPRDDGTVELWAHVEWGSPLNLRIHLAVTND